MNFVVRRNNENARGVEIPHDVAELFEQQLECKTGGSAKRGIRWEYRGTGTIFLELIKRHSCTVYILPTSANRKWKSLENLKKILADCELHYLGKNAEYRSGNKAHLRVRNVNWHDLKILAPKLVEWVYTSEMKGKLPRRINQLQPEWPPEKHTPQAIDINEPSQPERILQETYRVLRDTGLARMVKESHQYQCQICGQTLELCDGTLYAEAHHIIPLGMPHNGPDVRGNILCVCPNDHVLLDYGAIKLNEEHLDGIDKNSIKYHNENIYGKVLV